MNRSNAIKVALLALTLAVVPSGLQRTRPPGVVGNTSAAAQAVDPAALPGGVALDDRTAQDAGADDLAALYAGAEELAGQFASYDTFAAVAALPAPLERPADETYAQAAVPGRVVALAGTSHLWVSGTDGLYHWAGDTRGLAGKPVEWGTRREVSLDALKALSRGGPWLSLPLLMRAGDIYFPKWESNAERPTLLHIQSIADVELFGINGGNYGQLLKNPSDWEAATGIAIAPLATGSLPRAAPAPAQPQPQPQPAPPTQTPSPAADDPACKGFVTRTIEGTSYTFVPYWWYQSLQDGPLFSSLVVASTVSQDFRDGPASKIVAANTDFTWAALPPATHGSTNTRTSSVRVNNRLRGDTGGTAAVLAHEVYHAVYAQREGAIGCMQDEANAFSWGTGVWWRLPANLKLGSMAGEMNGLVALTQRGGPVAVLQLVQGMASYREQCSGR